MIYVPRDEVVEGTRRKEFVIGTWKGMLRNISPMVTTSYKKNIVSRDLVDLKGVYRNAPQGVKSLNSNGLFKSLDVIKEMFKFESPKNISCKCQANQIIVDIYSGFFRNSDK